MQNVQLTGILSAAERDLIILSRFSSVAVELVDTRRAGNRARFGNLVHGSSWWNCGG